MSDTKKPHDESKKGEKNYMWLGFGNYSGGGVQGPINPGNVRADPGIFDVLFKLFGMKDKPKNTTEEDEEEVRDPSW